MHPAAITGGRQGSLWLADGRQGTVLCLDTVSGRVIGSPIHVARGPIRVLVSSANLWVADSGDGTVTQIDTNSRRVLHTIKIGRYPHTLTSYFCRRGDKICDPYVLWVAVWSRPRPQYQGPPGFVERIDENTAQVLP
jgi:YVTN family beta-propeller protein